MARSAHIPFRLIGHSGPKGNKQTLFEPIRRQGAKCAMAVAGPPPFSAACPMLSPRSKFES